MKRLVIVLAAALVAVSCFRRPLDVEKDGIYVNIDTDYFMPYEACGTHPYHYAVLFYGSGDQLLTYEDFCGERGGVIHGVPGSYTAFVYDLDDAATRYVSKDTLSLLRAMYEEETEEAKSLFEACRISVPEDNILALPTKVPIDFQLLIKEPDAVYVGRHDGLVVPVLTDADEEFSFAVQSRYVLSQGRLTVKGITHAEYVSSAQVYLTGLAAGRYLASGAVVEDPATEMFYMDTIEEGIMQGVFNYFGNLSDEDVANIAYPVLTDTGGGRYLFVFDVTDQVREAGDNGDIVLVFDFDVPTPAVGGAGFQPLVGDWNIVYHEVVLGRID